MAKRELIIVKVGGSVLTNKHGYEQVNTTALERVAGAIAKAHSKHDVVLVIGVGSFGHPQVVKHGINNGVFTREKMIGVADTRVAVTRLSQLVLQTLIKHGVPAICFPVVAIAESRNKRLRAMFTPELQKILRAGFVPLLHGDMVFDSKLNASVLSGDQIVPFLAKKLHAKRMVFGTDVDGVFNADPKRDSSAKLIPLISGKNLKQLLHFLEEAKTADVTGGMKGKVTELLSYAKSAPIVITNANTQEFEKALLGEKARGTIVKR
ncbi:MAG TPA: isopentenyl phosphate kinase [Candidatus Norongarragalinales archaeon]|jgi:isopentenyl phosphate kinase|nr:isopentenyl phosphate kinase [Candidatus Norongarragalinales archaeon]